MTKDADLAARLTIVETAVACIIATSQEAPQIEALWNRIGEAFEATANAQPVPDEAIAKVIQARKQLRAMVAKVRTYRQEVG